MKSKQRFLTALRCEQPDRVPIFDCIDDALIPKLLDCLAREELTSVAGRDDTGQTGRAEQYCRLIQALDLDATWLDFSRVWERIDDLHRRDQYGNLFRLSEHGQPIIKQGAVVNRNQAKTFDMASRLHRDQFADANYSIKRLGPDRAHIMGLPDPFKESWYLRGGMENLLLDYFSDPDLVHALARIATDFSLGVIEIAADLGVDGFIMGGDLASSKTTLISPEHYRQFIKPYHRELVKHAHTRGLLIIKHSDGNVWPVLDDLVEIGFDGFHPVQPQCMEISEVKRYLSGKACVLGNIDCQDLLPSGTGEAVDEAVKATIQAAAPGGGYIMTSSNSIHPGCRPQNFVAMVRAGQTYGDYGSLAEPSF